MIIVFTSLCRTPLCSRHWTLHRFCHFLPELSPPSLRDRRSCTDPGITGCDWRWWGGGSHCTAAPDLRLPRPHSDPSCVILSTEVGHWWQLGGRAHHYIVHQYTIVHCTVQYRGKARPWPWLRTGPSRSGRLETGVSVSSRARPSLWLPGSRRL